MLGFLKQAVATHGDVIYFTIGPIKIALVNQPEQIKEILSVQHQKFVKGRPLEMAKALIGEGILTSEGSFHKKQARVIQPAFHRKRMESYIPAILDYTDRMMSHWEEGKAVDVREDMTTMTSLVAAKIMFQADIESDSKAIVGALDTATDLFGRIAVPYAEWLLHLPLPSSLQFRKAKKRLDELIYDLIAKRQENPSSHDDLLSMLLDPYGDGSGTGMSLQQVRDEAITLFLTAFDTTSTALTWTWYLLSQNPEAEAEFHAEIDRVLQGRLPTAEDVPKLSFTRKVMTEAMRLFPPTYVLPRQSVEDFEIGEYCIPKGTIVLMSQYLIHHDPRYYKHPEVFDPHRWDDREPQRYQYFPFSGGPRTCIGEPLAWLKGVLVLATVGQRWQLKLVPDHPVELLQLINLKPKHGMQMTPHRRTH